MSSFDLDDFLPYLLNRAATRLAETFTGELRRFDLTIVMWRVLAALRHGGPMRLGALAQRTSVEVSTLSRLVTVLQTRHLVSRTRDNEDARAVAVGLTGPGEAMTDAIIPIARHLEASILDYFSPEDAATLQRLLRTLNANIEIFDEDLGAL